MTATTIYYFTATGNSLAVARAIAGKLGDTKLVPLAHRDAANRPPDTQRVGLVFPVYVFGLPLIVTRFIEKLQVSHDSYLFAVAVHGGLPGDPLAQTARLLLQRGMALSAGFAVRMVDNYTPIAGAVSIEKQKRRFEEARLAVGDLCAAIENREQRMYRGWPLVRELFSWLCRRQIVTFPGLDRQFTVDSKCNGCGVCEQVCSVGNIKMNQRRPAWQHGCEQCLACLHWCPTEAIQHGKRTAGRARYHHPDVKVKDIIVPDLPDN